MQEVVPDNSSIPDLIPASMLAAYAFCPRLCYLQFLEGEFADSAALAEGRLAHRWIDAVQDPIPEGFRPFHARSVSLDARRPVYAAASTSWRGMAKVSRRWSTRGARPGQRDLMSRI